MEKFKTKGASETIELAKKFALQNLKAGSVVALYGELGSGKTHFVKGICKAFDIEQNISSPSFTILNEYKSANVTIYHFDFFRIHDISELTEIGFDDYIYSNGISLIEWADRIEEILPSTRYNVFFSHTNQEDERIIKIQKL